MSTMQIALLLSLSLGLALAGRTKMLLDDALDVDAKFPPPLTLQVHSVARSNTERHPEYPARFEVPGGMHVFWSFDWRFYKPTNFTHAKVLAQPAWADPPSVITDPSAPEWSDQLHKTYTTCSAGMSAQHIGRKISTCFSPYLVAEKRRPGHWSIPHEGNMPLNPMGRTGMTGRGILGKFGANHAADPIVTRFHEGSLEVVLIKRADGGKLALPGGMVEAGDTVSKTLSKEFQEEALRGNKPQGMSDVEWARECQRIAILSAPIFENGKPIYAGYVDDPRNTDNAWMETAAYHFHAAAGVWEHVNLQAGDDAEGVRWVKVLDAISEEYNMYASHKAMIGEMYRKHCARKNEGC